MKLPCGAVQKRETRAVIFQGGVWSLSTVLCDALMTMDVMLCTASIFNLCAISVDRFIAVSIPLNYNRRQIDLRQLILISTTWIFAFAVASPVIFGLNNVPNRDPSLCQLEDDNYIVRLLERGVWFAEDSPFAPGARSSRSHHDAHERSEVDASDGDFLHNAVRDVHLVGLYRHRGRLAADVLVVLPVLPGESRWRGHEGKGPLESAKGPKRNPV
ncbi:d dophypothetical protein [Limosa lapponica baueri]|uniref:G-protein coupled receptors family 1 profile domain-containing protein n=1 Tax=Limosa lapponica baueri TaxID=1758121 RepID=A0A2I0TF05_LIMLA|nr:d dophypothetical protein [Limosa lapponica baueri]